MKKPAGIRILHISTAKTWRGGEQQVAYLVDELKKQNWNQWIFCPENSELEDFCKRQDWPFLSFTRRFPISLLTAFYLFKICKTEDIGLIHVHDAKAHTLAVIASTFSRINIPVVVSRRVDFPIGKTAWSRWKYNHESIKKIICVSDFIKRLLIPHIINPEKLAVVHSGIDVTRFHGKQKTGNLRLELGLSDKIPLIANIAAIAPHKDYFTFVDTAEEVLKKLDCRFLIIGADGGEGGAIRKYISNRNLQDKVLILGWRSDIPSVLSEIDLLLFTSKTEGLGTTILDAFAAGVPVVATETGGIHEIVFDEINGLTAGVGDSKKLAEQVLRIMSDAELRKKLCLNAKDNVQLFTKKTMAGATIAIYRQILHEQQLQ